MTGFELQTSGVESDRSTSAPIVLSFLLFQFLNPSFVRCQGPTNFFGAKMNFLRWDFLLSMFGFSGT